MEEEIKKESGMFVDRVVDYSEKAVDVGMENKDGRN